MTTKWYRNKWIILVILILSLAFLGTLIPEDQTKMSSVKNNYTVKRPQTNANNLRSTTTKTKIEPIVSATKIPVSKVNNDESLYRVTKVVDGDTISVLINDKTETLRLIGINTPETVDPRKPVECFGKEASNKAKSILEGQSVRLAADPSQGERDKYGRLLRYVFLPTGTFFNKLMIQEGYAYEYTYNTPYKYQTEFKQAEQEAKLAKRGLWGDSTCGGSSTSAPTQTIQPAPAQSAPSGKYTCSYNAYNCANFTSQSEAQAAFEACGGTTNDVHELDRDGDGRVCESLP